MGQVVKSKLSSGSIHRTKPLLGGAWGGVQFLKNLIMGIDVYTLASEYPDTVIQLKVSDLVEAARVFAKDLAIELTMEIEKEENESVVPNFPQSLLTKREVMKLLGVGETTLWRWATQYDYLRPVMIGGERRWKRKDIEAIMEGNVVDYYGKPISSRKKYTVKDKGNM